MIGTPFISEDEIIQRKVDKISKKPWEQEVRDDKGRKRLHGAFTGGFSAGYFNTVGTKEGWTTSSFRSSRNERKETKNRKDVIDFMDEEDIRDQIGDSRLSSSDNFNIYNKRISSENEKIIQEYTTMYNDEIGKRILIESGLYDVKKDEFEKNSKEKYYNLRLEFKNDYSGVGFSKTIENEKLNRNYFSKEKNSNIIKMDNFENEEDNIEYNFQILEENIKSKKRIRDEQIINEKFIKSKKFYNLSKIDFKMPKIPNNYDPYSNYIREKASYNLEEEFKKLNYNKNINNKSNSNINEKMDASKRFDILELEIGNNQIYDKNLNISQESVNPYLRDKFTKAEIFDFKDLNKKNITFHKNRPDENLSLNENVIEKDEPSSVNQFNCFFNFKIHIPFKNDIGKMARFSKFVAEKEGLIVDIPININLMTNDQSKSEKKEFEDLYQKQKERKMKDNLKKVELTSGNLCEIEQIKEKIKKIKNSEVKIESSIWKPNPILCKRFKIKDPYENKINSLDHKNEELVKFKKGENNYLMSSLQYQLFKQETNSQNNKDNFDIKLNERTNKSSFQGIEEIKDANNKINIFETINKKMDINLFDEIFG